jgi:MFS family permease
MSGIMANLIPCGLLFYKIERSIKTSELVGTSKLFDTVVFRQWRYHVLLVCLFLFAFSGFVESRFLVDEMLVKGFERQTGSEFMSYIGLMNFCGRIVGFVSKLIIPGKGILQMSLFTLINGGSHAIIIFSGSYYGILFGALLNGFSYGLCVTQIPVLMLEIFPDKLYGPAISVMNLVGGIGSILVGYFGGFIFDVTNNYTILFDIAAAFSVLIASLLLIVGLSLTASTIKQSEYTKL